ncbi:hypothetical protein ACIQF6_04080 [Kitasatospora sp. NPDC092948]|uniref:hypothetical protein n=1 Tax=Kitasatospora sp. NPDC092948 TaxID=3364088 RepID=UPI003815E17E
MTPVQSSGPVGLGGVINRTRALVMSSTPRERAAPDPEGLILIQAWPGGAAYMWETDDQRQCDGTADLEVVWIQRCNLHPVDPPISSPAGVHSLGTFFTDGWVRVIGTDHQEVVGAFCGNAPLEVHRVGTILGGARTVYALWFPNYTKGSVTVVLDHEGVTSRTSLHLGDVGDLSCTPTP